MRDIWGFLLQTLTASGGAVLLLAVKAMFQDKLPPRWQAASWGLLGVLLALPAGLGGRYALVNWSWLVETLKTTLTGDYGTVTRVIAPIPLPRLALPETAAEWIFVIYVLGVLFFLGKYVVAYLRLRWALSREASKAADREAQIKAVAERYGLPACPAVEVPGLSSAFVCGVARPLLALPAGVEVDDKVLLHELLHLKHGDAVWGLVICLFRCLHWCNPLLWACADRAGNDLEALCDQRVLERLEGEDRRDYGRILLSMADEKYARAPGTSSMANGGKNIRRRIEAITRFKKYPAGMGLVSLCVILLLAAPLVMGTQARTVYEGGGNTLAMPLWQNASMASARTVRCTTAAGALDAYGKAVLEQNPIYRALCAPLEEQAALAEELRAAFQQSREPEWDSGLPSWPKKESGYCIYNLQCVRNEYYEGQLVVELNYPPDGQAAKENTIYLAVQDVRVEQQDGRWVVLPLAEYRTAEIAPILGWTWGSQVLPAYVYQAVTKDFRVQVRYQKVFEVDNWVQEEGFSFFGASRHFDTTPKPHAEFSEVRYDRSMKCTYIGDEERKREIRVVGLSVKPWNPLEERPALAAAQGGGNSSSSDGAAYGSLELSGDWGPEIAFGGGGSGHPFDPEEDFELPASYAADLYINNQKAEELTLYRIGGDRSLD